MYLFLTVFSLLSIFPLYYMFCAATNKSVDVIAGRLIPGTYLLENYKALIGNQNLGLALLNSFRNSIVLTLLCLVICSIAGYGFEIYHDKGKDAVFTVLLTAMMIPFAAIMIPMFRLHVPYVFNAGNGKHYGGFHASVDFHAVHDYDVPTGIEVLPSRYYRGCPHRRTQRDRYFLPYVHAYHALYLCGGNDNHLYERME